MNSEQRTPAGKVPLDYLMWLYEIRNKDLATKTGISEQDVSRYRRGLRPRPEHRRKIARFLKTSEAELGWTPEPVDA